MVRLELGGAEVEEIAGGNEEEEVELSCIKISKKNRSLFFIPKI